MDNITFICCASPADCNVIEVAYEDAITMGIIRFIIENLGHPTRAIPLSNKYATIENMRNVIRFITASREHSADEIPLSAQHTPYDWEAEFFAGVSYAEIFEGFMFARYIHYDEYEAACVNFIGYNTKGTRASEIRDMYGIPNDFIPGGKWSDIIEIDTPANATMQNPTA